jgi:hypothetical protein
MGETSFNCVFGVCGCDCPQALVLLVTEQFDAMPYGRGACEASLLFAIDLLVQNGCTLERWAAHLPCKGDLYIQTVVTTARKYWHITIV